MDGTGNVSAYFQAATRYPTTCRCLPVILHVGKSQEPMTSQRTLARQRKVRIRRTSKPLFSVEQKKRKGLFNGSGRGAG
jgi:hypothetical protein